MENLVLVKSENMTYPEYERNFYSKNQIPEGYKLHPEYQYLLYAKYILEHGKYVAEERTGTGANVTFGHQMRFNLKEGFPLLTTKRVFWKAVFYELKWFLMGDTNVKYLNDNGIRIWDEWADENGDLGPVYGYQWRSWPVGPLGSEIKIDQIKKVINDIKTKPYSRRHIVSAWNPALVDDMALPPCHSFFQFNILDGELSCELFQRSADWFLGVPFNIASYALLTHMIAHVTGLKVGDYVHSFGNAHIYSNHVDQINEQLTRQPYEFPTLKINRDPSTINDISEINFEDIEILNYKSHKVIKGDIAV